MYKLYLASIVFLLYCVGFGIIWLHQIKLQFFALVISLLLVILILGIRKLWLQLRILLPFVTMLFVIYASFVLLGISPAGTQPLAYWIAYGLPRALLLLSSIMMFRLCFALVSVDDLIRSDLGIHQKKYLILGKILYEAAFHSYRQIKLWQQLCPSMKDSPKSLKERFQRALAGTLGLILYTLAEARTKGERIDNLIQTCYKEKQ
jgi:hypothetical protein